MRRRPPIYTRTETLFPYTTLFRAPLILALGLYQQKQVQTGGVSGDTVGVDPGKRCAAAIWRDVALSPGRPLRNGREECPTSSRTPPVQEAMALRSEEHTSELQSLMRISYAVFCLKKKTPKTT